VTVDGEASADSAKAKPETMSAETLIEIENVAGQRRNSYQGSGTPHLNRTRISYIAEARPGDLGLDLGCCDAAHRRIFEALGYKYCGVDIVNRGADALADAHALPFRAGTFALVLCISVLQYLTDPQTAMREVERILQPGGQFIGSVAFLEAWDGDSLVHFTPRGLARLLQTVGLHLERIAIDPSWHVVRAQLQMGPLRNLPPTLSKALAAPFLWLVRTHGLAGRLLSRNPSEHNPAAVLARHAGALFFIARRRQEGLQLPA